MFHCTQQGSYSVEKENSDVQMQPLLHKSAPSSLGILLVIKKWVACSCATPDDQSVRQAFLPLSEFSLGAVFVLPEVLGRPPTVLKIIVTEALGFEPVLKYC